jgi:hypothetical protein
MATVRPGRVSGTNNAARRGSFIDTHPGFDFWSAVPALARRRRHEDWEFVRDIVLFFSGLVGVFYELVVGAAEPGLLVVFAAMLGLPITLRGGKNG